MKNQNQILWLLCPLFISYLHLSLIFFRNSHDIFNDLFIMMLSPYLSVYKLLVPLSYLPLLILDQVEYREYTNTLNFFIASIFRSQLIINIHQYIRSTLTHAFTLNFIYIYSYQSHMQTGQRNDLKLDMPAYMKCGQTNSKRLFSLKPNQIVYMMRE